MIKVEFIYMNKTKMFNVLVNGSSVIKGRSDVKYQEKPQTSRLTAVFPFIAISSRCG